MKMTLAVVFLAVAVLMSIWVLRIGADARCRQLVRDAAREVGVESSVVIEGRHHAGRCEFRFVTPWQSGGKL